MRNANRLLLLGLCCLAMQVTLGCGHPYGMLGTTATPEEPAVLDEYGLVPPTSYVLKRGDTLWDIAVRFYGDGSKWKLIAGANSEIFLARSGELKPGAWKPGQVITIPELK